MDKLGDMDLFVRVVRAGGLAAAGREINLSPASVSARITALEQRHDTRLLNRTTRSLSITEAGQAFYDASIRILADMAEVELQLLSSRTQLAGPLNVTATSDLGQQHVAPLLSKLVDKHPGIAPYLHLTDGIVNIAEQNIDLAIRYCEPPDSSLIAKRLAPSYRVLCASRSYLEKKGVPTKPEHLAEHDCLAMVKLVEPLTNWYFTVGNKEQTVSIKPARSSNDGALVRKWALEGHGIMLKSYLDIAEDLKTGRLVSLLEPFSPDYHRSGSKHGADLYVVYPTRQYVPERVRTFIDMLEAHFKTMGRNNSAFVDSLHLEPN